MVFQLIGAAVLFVLFAETARAQIIPGDSPTTTQIYWTGIGSNLSSEDRWRDTQAEQSYREVVKRIPDRKPSNDPWKTVRPAATASQVDRHRPQ